MNRIAREIEAWAYALVLSSLLVGALLGGIVVGAWR